MWPALGPAPSQNGPPKPAVPTTGRSTPFERNCRMALAPPGGKEHMMTTSGLAEEPLSRVTCVWTDGSEFWKVSSPTIDFAPASWIQRCLKYWHQVFEYSNEVSFRRYGLRQP